ncbi:enoyl-CoA-hydratase DpgD [Actinophytocola sp.]|uniref:enoyl-CoA-hydratase DpgD n=1 Tax=Actinophytocola sp. TaxID=1872138 RepID=UPI00389A78AC
MIRYEKSGHVARVTLNRPEVLNAMNLAMHAELCAAWDDIEADDEIWVVVLTGAGDRAFSVGQDLKELVRRIEAGTATSTFGSRDKPGWPRLTERFRFAKPVVAAVNGLALGGGFELALAADIIVAVEEAEFALPEARLGLIAGAGGVFRLTQQIPYRTALGYLMTGRRIPASRALALGLVNDVVPAESLESCVDGWVSDLLRAAPLSVRAVKEAASRALTMPVEQAFATRFTWEEKRTHSADAEEGPRSFVEKREPQWRGS